MFIIKNRKTNEYLSQDNSFVELAKTRKPIMTPDANKIRIIRSIQIAQKVASMNKDFDIVICE